MFAGHIGAALAIGRFERRVNVGVFVAAAVLLDLLLWPFVLVGLESVSIPADFAARHQAEFVFPYSHGLIAASLWSLLAAAAAWACYGCLGAARVRVAALVAAAVLSHWILDAFVHRPELPLAGATSRVFGLGLWDSLPTALWVEGVLTVVGVFMFVSARGLPRARSLALALACLAILSFTVAGMTVAPPPPSAFAMAASSLATLIALCALVAWLGRLPRS